MSASRRCRFVAVLIATAAFGCGAGETEWEAASSIAVGVEPSSATLGHLASLQFEAVVTGTVDTAVAWSVDCGSITQGGLFTAPATNTVCHVVARSQADTTKSASATVTVTSAPPPPPMVGWAATCAAEPFPTSGTRYYVCDCASGADPNCAAGNDANPGTSPDAPKRSWGAAKDRWRALPAGGTLALCKGGKWSGNDAAWSDWRNTSCTAANPCLLRDYTPPWASGDEGRPLVTVSGNASPIVFAGGVRLNGIRVLNLHLVNTTSTGAGVGITVDGAVYDVEVCNTVIDSFSFGVYTMGWNGAGGGYRQHFRGNRLLNNCTDAALVTSRDSDWDGNYFDNNGHAACGSYNLFDTSGGTTHTWYLDGDGEPVGNIRFLNNEIHRSSVHPTASLCVGNALAVNAGDRAHANGLIIENNYFDTPKVPGCLTQFAAGGSWGVELRGLVIRGNHIEVHEGNALAFSQAPDALIENNVIVSTGSGAGWWDNEALVSLPHKTGAPASAGGTVRNNTIYVAGTSGNRDGRVAIAVARDPGATGYNVTGNAIYVAPGGAISACFRVGSASRLAFMDNNLCSGSGTWVQHEANGTDYTLSSWRSFSGRDASSTTAQPAFLDGALPGLDLTPAAGSVLVGAGSASATCTVRGIPAQSCASPNALSGPSWSATATPKNRDAAPDIGAFER